MKTQSRIEVVAAVIRGALISLWLLAVPACRQQAPRVQFLPLWDQWSLTQAVLTDTTATLDQIRAAVSPLAASLEDAVQKTDQLQDRLLTQQLSYAAVFLLDDQFKRLEAAGQAVSQPDRDKLVSPLVAAAGQWIYSVEDGTPCVWRDLYYLSNKTAPDPVDGYFHLMVLLPSQSNPEPAAHFFFPASASSKPAVLFRKYKPGGTEEDAGSQDLVILQEWYEKGALGEGFPLYVVAGEDLVRRMMENDVMYLLYESAATSAGVPGEDEVAQVPLRPFQDKFKEATRK